MANGIKSKRDTLNETGYTSKDSTGLRGSVSKGVNPNSTTVDPLTPYLNSLSDADKGLSEEGQRYIAQQKYDWARANEAGDQNAMKQANLNAQNYRYNNGGYYANSDGTGKITRDNVYVSGADKNHFSPDQMEEAIRNKMMVQAGLMSTEDANAMAEADREMYGYSGGKYGDKYLRLKNADGSNQFSYNGLPESVNKYQQMIQEMSNNLLNQGAFSYDPYSDPLYQLYAQQYTAGGQSAMQNTLAQIAARTGGLASSYAGTAAQNAYNGYMSQLANKIPELYQLAYGMYRDRINDQRDNLALLQNLSDADYNRYANERNFSYQNYLGNRDYNYQYNRDKNDDYRFEAERADATKDRAIDLMKYFSDYALNMANIGVDAAADGVDWNTYYGQGLQYTQNPQTLQDYMNLLQMMNL